MIHDCEQNKSNQAFQKSRINEGTEKRQKMNGTKLRTYTDQKNQTRETEHKHKMPLTTTTTKRRDDLKTSMP